MCIKAISDQLKIHILLKARTLIEYELDDAEHLKLVEAAVALQDPKVDVLLTELAIECRQLSVSDSVCRLMSQWQRHRDDCSDSSASYSIH